jgi:hypothetical protein
MTPKIIYDFDPRNLPADILAAIGLSVASSAQTENMMELAIAGCLGVDSEYGMAITTHMPAPLRFSVLRSAAEIRLSVPQLDELDEILDEIRLATDSRNATVHAQLCVHPTSKECFVVKKSARAGVEIELVPQTVDKIKREALSMYEAGMRLWRFLDAHGFMPTLPPLRPRGHKTKSARKKLRNKRL